MNEHVGSHWFISLNGKSHGPFTFTTLAKAAADGVITADTDVWRRGWKKWHPARQIPGLLNETPLAPVSGADDSVWADTRPDAPDAEALLYAPKQRGGRSPRADEWGMLAVRPPQDGDDIRSSSWFGRKKTATAIDLDDDRGISEHLTAKRTRAAENKLGAGRFRKFCRRVAIGSCALLVAWGVGRGLFWPGSSRQ